MSGPNVQAFIHVMSTRDSALLLPIAKAISSVDNAMNQIQLLFLNVALNQVKIIVYCLTKLEAFLKLLFIRATDNDQ